MSQLFRTEALQRRLESIGVPPGITPVWMRVYSIGLVLALVAAGCVIAFGQYARKSRVAGFLAPDKGLIKILPGRDGRVLERRVAEGERVAKGDVLFVIDVASVTSAGRTADLVAARLKERRALISVELKRLDIVHRSDADRLDASIASLQQQIAAAQAEQAARRDLKRLSEASLNRFRRLETREVYSQAQREKSEQAFVSAAMQIAILDRAVVAMRGELAQAQAQRSGLLDRQANERSQLMRSLAELDQQQAQTEEQRELMVRATEAGVVTRLTANPGSHADAATPLATLVPQEATLEANLYVPSAAAGFVKPGAAVLIRYDAYPYQKFGVQDAVVSSIARASVNPKELPFAVPADEPLYVVTARLAKTTVTAFGREEALQAGARFQADLVLEERRLWEWIVEPLLAARASL